MPKRLFFLNNQKKIYLGETRRIYSFSIKQLKYALDIERILYRGEANFNSHPSFKNFKPWQTYSFLTKE